MVKFSIFVQLVDKVDKYNLESWSFPFSFDIAGRYAKHPRE